MFSLAAAFRHAGNDARILSLRPGGKPGLELGKIPKSVPVYWCTPASRRKTLSATVASFRPDVVALHFAGRSTPWLDALLRLRKQGGFKLAMAFQDYRHPDLSAETPAQFRQLRRALLAADSVSAVSSFLKHRLAHDFPHCAAKIAVIPNGAPPMAKPRENAAARPYILCAGRLAHYKGTDLLLMAYAAARAQGLRSRLVLCGADFENGRLQKFSGRLGLENCVTFAGLLAPKRAEKLLRNCLFFALFSRFESFGMAALEAMASGKAALLSGAGGMRDFAAHNANALFVKPQDTASAAKLLLRLEKDARLRARLGAAGRKTAAKFRWENVAGKYLDFYRG